MFLLGLNDGLLSRATDSLLTPEERAQTQQGTGAFLGLTDESRALMARLDVKRAMTLPTRWLFLSSAKTAPDGTALRPLSLLSQLRDRLMPGLARTPIPEDELPLSSAQALGALGILLRAHADGAAPPRAPLARAHGKAPLLPGYRARRHAAAALSGL